MRRPKLGQSDARAASSSSATAASEGMRCSGSISMVAALPFAMDMLRQGNTKDFTHTENGLGFEVTQTALEDADAIVCTGLEDDRNETAETYRPLLARALAIAAEDRFSPAALV